LKIVHVVTYVSKDGAFGGPISVALAQLTELARRGHDVELMAGWDGEAELRADGVKISLFRATRLVPKGFSGVWARGLLAAVRDRARTGAVIHIHMGRDLTTLGSALALSRLPTDLVLQTHGMVMPDARVPVRILDLFFTRVVLANAHRVLALTDEEVVGLRAITRGRVKISEIANGVSRTEISTAKRNPNEVVFLARLHPRKRVMHFARMCAILVERGLPVKCVVIGPDEGDLPELMEFLSRSNLGDALVYEGPLPSGQGQERLGRASVFVLPSVGEVFPMTILEALAARTPVVTTVHSGIAPLLKNLRAALVTDGTPLSLADAVESVLTDEEVREFLVKNGQTALENRFSIGAVATQLIEIYAKDPEAIFTPS
jgi:glycosyltransferase involved in cell wall biosynthesis